MGLQANMKRFGQAMRAGVAAFQTCWAATPQAAPPAPISDGTRKALFYLETMLDHDSEEYRHAAAMLMLNHLNDPGVIAALVSRILALGQAEEPQVWDHAVEFVMRSRDEIRKGVLAQMDGSNPAHVKLLLLLLAKEKSILSKDPYEQIIRGIFPRMTADQQIALLTALHNVGEPRHDLTMSCMSDAISLYRANLEWIVRERVYHSDAVYALIQKLYMIEATYNPQGSGTYAFHYVTTPKTQLAWQAFLVTCA